jgi:hypothetical protein
MLKNVEKARKKEKNRGKRTFLGFLLLAEKERFEASFVIFGI